MEFLNLIMDGDPTGSCSVSSSDEESGGIQNFMSLETGELEKVGESGNCGFAGSLFNLVNTIVGSGVLGLPFAMKSAGIGLGTLLLIISAIFAYISIYYLVKMSTFTKCKSYESVGNAAFGVVGEKIVEISFLLQNSGSLTGLICVVGDVGPALANSLINALVPGGVGFAGEILCSRYFWMSLTVLFFILPLTFVWNLSGLKFTSYIAIAIVFCFVSTVIFRFIVPFDEPFDVFRVPKQVVKADLASFNLYTFLAIPIFTFSFVCHTNLLHIYGELKHRSFARMQVLSGIAIGLCFLLYALTGIVGYLSFQEDTNGDVLLNFADDDWLVDIVRFLYIFTILFSYPIILYPTRKALEGLFVGTERPSKMWRFWLAGAFILIVTYMLASLIPVIQVIFGISGSTTGIVIVFILPPVFYLKLSRDHSVFFSAERVMAVIMILYGLIFGSISLFASLRSAYVVLFEGGV